MSEGVCVEALTLTLGAFRLKNVDFAVSGGEILIILGPNGSGKSVTLETIAGFHRPDFGRVLIKGRDVTALPPEQRNIGFVVQNFGLFPHLTVAQNIGIAKRADRAVTARDANFPPHGNPDALLKYFGIAHLAERAPADLSPGEKQRVALARALASAPDLFLFDEPFSALDGQTANQLRDELLSFLRMLSIPAIFVTHDRGDAMMLADKMIVLRDGAIVQTGPAAEIFQKPASAFVARFIGVENILDGRVADLSGELITLHVGDQMLSATAPAKPIAAGTQVVVSIRAEDVALRCSSRTQTPQTNQFEGRITALHAGGPLVTASIDCGFPLKAYVLAPQAREMNLGIGMAVAVEIAPASIQILAE